MPSTVDGRRKWRDKFGWTELGLGKIWGAFLVCRVQLLNVRLSYVQVLVGGWLLRLWQGWNAHALVGDRDDAAAGGEVVLVRDGDARDIGRKLLRVHHSEAALVA